MKIRMNTRKAMMSIKHLEINHGLLVFVCLSIILFTGTYVAINQGLKSIDYE